MSKALVIIKSRGIGDICVLASNVHALSQKIGKPVTVLAQKNTHANSIFEHDKHVSEVIELEERGFFNIIRKIKKYNFDQAYIYSDSIRLYLISKLSGINQIFHYRFFSKKGKNFFKTAKEFTEKLLNKEIDPQSKIYCDENEVLEAKKNYNISSNTKNIVCGISASGPTKRWDINNFIKLFEKLNAKYKCKFFLAGGPKDEELIKKVMDSSVGKNCISFSKMSIAKTMPIISSCQYCITNDSGFGHMSSGLGLKCIFLFMDSPPLAYGVYSKNINIICPEGLTLEQTGHNTRGKDKISVDKVFEKAIQLIN